MRREALHNHTGDAGLLDLVAPCAQAVEQLAQNVRIAQIVHDELASLFRGAFEIWLDQLVREIHLVFARVLAANLVERVTRAFVIL